MVYRTGPVEEPEQELTQEPEEPVHKAARLGISWKVAVVLLLTLISLPAAAHFIGSSDVRLKGSAVRLVSALMNVTTTDLSVSPATVTACEKLSANLKALQRAKLIEDTLLGSLETNTRKLADLLRTEKQSKPVAQMALQYLVHVLGEFEQDIGLMYFIAQDELQERLHNITAHFVYKLRKFSIKNADELGAIFDSVRENIQQRFDYQQLGLDMISSAISCSLVCVLSKHRSWRHQLQLCALPLVTFLALQLLQWRSRVVSFESVTSVATTAIIAFASCLAATYSILGNYRKLFMPMIILLLAIGAQLMTQACSVRAALDVPCPQEVPCPRDAVRLVTYDRLLKQLELDPAAVFRLPKLKGPVYVISEIGGFNTGKSVRITVSYRQLLSKSLRNKCKCGFRVRNADVEVGEGVTRGMWMMSLPVSAIELSDINSEGLKNSLANLNDSGTVIFLDSEGSDETGQDLASVNLLQLLVIQLSSHVNFAIKDIIEPRIIKRLGMLAHLCKLYTVFEEGRQSCQLDQESKVETVKVPSIAIISMYGRELLPYFKKIKQEARTVIAVPNPLNLDATVKLTAELLKALYQEDTKSAAENVFTYLKEHLEYWGTLPATEKEEKFFQNMGSTPGLPVPTSSDPGFLYGWSMFNLPKLFSTVKRKTSGRTELNGTTLLELINQIIHISKNISNNNSWLNADATTKVSEEVCKTISEVTASILNGTDALALYEKLPIESTPLCVNEKCTAADFEKEWSVVERSINDTLCLMRKIMSDEMWHTCWRDRVQTQIVMAHNGFLRKNQELCEYHWEVASNWSDCTGTCPGHSHRRVNCYNKQNHKRPDECCNIKVVLPYEKPCENWSYDWSLSEWSPCSSKNCGSQSRSVICKRCDGQAAEDGMCLKKAAKPPTSEKCNVRYTFHCHCEDKHKKQWCHSNCNEDVEESFCGDADENLNRCKCSEAFGAQNFVQFFNLAEYKEGKTLNFTELKAGMNISAADFANADAPVIIPDEIESVRVDLKRTESNFVSIQAGENAKVLISADHMLPVRKGVTGFKVLRADEIKEGDSVLTKTVFFSTKLLWTPVDRISSNLNDFPVVMRTKQNYALVGNIVVATSLKHPQLIPKSWYQKWFGG